MKPLFFLLILLMSSSGLSAQEAPSPKQYHFGERQVFFEDAFDDDRNGWLNTSRKNDDEADPPSKDNSVSKYMIEGGYYDYQVIEGKRPYAHAIPLVIDQQKNFEIELSVKLDAQKKHKVAGVLFWGRFSKERCTYLICIPAVSSLCCPVMPLPAESVRISVVGFAILSRRHSTRSPYAGITTSTIFSSMKSLRERSLFSP